MHPSGARPPGPWHESYRPIDDPSAEEFLNASLEKAIDRFGEPVIPVNQVILRRSRKADSARRYRIGENFSLTECIDPVSGIFVVYIGVDPDHRDFHALLAHECVHLLNPYITDWYMEGLATVFSEEACLESDGGWGNWRRRFEKSRRDPYALSYRLMREIKQSFPYAYGTLPRFTAANEQGKGAWLRIDIDAWISSLAPEARPEAVRIIKSYSRILLKNRGDLYDFAVPSGDL